MRKTFWEAMKVNALFNLTNVKFEVIGVSTGEQVNKESGEVEKYVRIEVEVPKGLGEYSRCRFSVKVVNKPLLLEEDAVDNAVYIATFDKLKITFLDSRGNVYFSAEDYSITEAD